MKTRAWDEVAQKLCAMGIGPSRTLAEVKRKWHNAFSQSKRKILSFRGTVFGTGQLVIVLQSAIISTVHIKLKID